MNQSSHGKNAYDICSLQAVSVLGHVDFQIDLPSRDSRPGDHAARDRRAFERQLAPLWWPRRAFPTCRSDVERCRADVAAMALRRRSDVGPMSGRCRCDGAATSGRCRVDVAAMTLRRRADVGPMSGRCRCDGAATSLRRRADVAAIALRHRSDVAVMALRRRCNGAPMYNMRMHINMSTGHALHGRRQDMMEEPGTSSRRVTHRPDRMSLSTALCTTSL